MIRVATYHIALILFGTDYKLAASAFLFNPFDLSLAGQKYYPKIYLHVHMFEHQGPHAIFTGVGRSCSL